jgi:DNA-binding XRE family transcriptional regulator
MTNAQDLFTGEFQVSPEREAAFQQLIRQSRQLHGWSQEQAAKEAKTSQSVISAIENGPYRGMGVWELYKLCRAYGLGFQQVLDVLGWSVDEPPVDNVTQTRIAALNQAFKRLSPEALEPLLHVVERYVIGSQQ